MSKDIHYKPMIIIKNHPLSNPSIIFLKGKDFKDVDKIMEDAQDDINSLDEDGVISSRMRLLAIKELN